MSRAGVLLVHEDAVALIERHRTGRHYYLFPGGSVEDGETLEEAAIREAEEELGLVVEIVRLVAEVAYRRRDQYYFLARVLDGVFGTGQGAEMTGHARPGAGTYTPVWVPVADLLDREIHPRCVAEVVVRSLEGGWPECPVALVDPGRGF